MANAASKLKVLNSSQGAGHHPHSFQANNGKSLEIVVGNNVYLRLPIKTRLITEKDNLRSLLHEYVSPHLLHGDIVFISEKIVAITQNRIIKIRDIKPSFVARFLAKRVDNKRHTVNFRGFGHGTSMGMELFIEEAGYLRVLFAAAVSAVTRPFGIKGLFYIICGKNAKSIDCPMSFTLYPYLSYAKLAPLNPKQVAKDAHESFGNEVVIVDANYRGVFSLAKSTRKISEKFIQNVFRDNPAGQSDEMTPFFIVRMSS
jgi:hypothetical protein